MLRRPARQDACAAGQLLNIGMCDVRNRPASVYARYFTVHTRGSMQDISYPATMPSPKLLRVWQPKKLLQSRVDGHKSPDSLPEQIRGRLKGGKYDPAKLLQLSLRSEIDASPSLLLEIFVYLGRCFGPNTFFATADRQNVVKHIGFKRLCRDICEALESHVPLQGLDCGVLCGSQALQILFSMACLEYRFWQIMPLVLNTIERNLNSYRFEALSIILHSLSVLNIGGRKECIFNETRSGGRDYRDLGTKVLDRLASYLTEGEGEDFRANSVERWDWAQVVFSAMQLDLWHQRLPQMLQTACAGFPDKDRAMLDDSGWFAYWVYMTLYCCDVLRPEIESDLKRAVPLWMQEMLHENWLKGTVLKAQPQGMDALQMDVNDALRRTNTQALVNQSLGRARDEQHCFFSGHVLHPRIALDYCSASPIGPGRPLESGAIALKQRIFARCGVQSAVIHGSLWNKLSSDQKDEQVVRLRAQLGYRAQGVERKQITNVVGEFYKPNKG